MRCKKKSARAQRAIRAKRAHLAKKAAVLGMFAALTVGCVVLRADADGVEGEDKSSSDTSKTSDTNEYSSGRIDTNYSKVSAAYKMSDYKGDAVVYGMEDAATGDSRSKLTEQTKDYEDADTVLQLQANDKVKLKLDVPEDGLYFMDFDYISYDESILPVSMGMTVDGDYPFYECRNVSLDTTWKLSDEPSYDRYENQVVTVPEKNIKWESKYLMDSSYRHSSPLKLELSEGEHVFELEVKEGTLLLGNLTLEAPSVVEEYKGSEKADGNQLIPIQGENYYETNSSSIHGVAEYDTSLEPYEVTDTRLNTLDSDSFADAGQRVTYQFEVKEAGYYYIAQNYRQSDKTDFPVFVDIEVDGKIPNTAFQSYGMAYTTNYKTTTLTDSNGNNLSVYFDKGMHTISYTISMDNICYIMEEIDTIMSGVNDLALEITKVAGNNSDKYRDLRLSRYIPNLDKTLRDYSDRLTELEKSAIKWSDSDDGVAVMSSMLIAAQQLRSLAENPDEIPYRVGELSTSQNSVNHYLAQAIDDLIVNGLAIDRVYIYQESAELPEKPGFFKSIGMNIRRFIASFTEQDYSASNTNDENLQVWVNRSSQYVQIMQKMIDEYFTPETGIEVDISIMPDQYKLVLANSSGNAPDVATGINYTIPYELAVRGALVDMTQYSDFQEAAKPYEPGFFMTGTIGDQVFSMPETMNFWVLFYRTDIMDKLGIGVPQTMDDMINMLPTLQMRGLNMYYPTAGMLLMRNFHGTTPLMVQNGGSLYNSTASQGVALGDETTVNGFEKLTDLFTVYNMPVNCDNFYQHFRNGDYPIGIADYATYNMITNAAPELKSSWNIALAPGTIQEDGTIDRSVCGCAEASVIFKSDSEREQKAWKFIKWWSSTETQAEFGQTIQISYGDDYIWPTANMDAFKELPLPADHKQVIRDTAKNVVDVARVPGTYLLEREVSNAFNDVTVNGDNLQSRIDKAVKSVNHEFDRKLEEFGYNDSNGNVIEEYNIPTIDSVTKLLGRNKD